MLVFLESFGELGKDVVFPLFFCYRYRGPLPLGGILASAELGERHGHGLRVNSTGSRLENARGQIERPGPVAKLPVGATRKKPGQDMCRGSSFWKLLMGGFQSFTRSGKRTRPNENLDLSQVRLLARRIERYRLSIVFEGSVQSVLCFQDVRELHASPEILRSGLDGES